MKGGRPARPHKEAQLVWSAIAGCDPSCPKEPLARDLARRVVAELAIEIQAISDPLTADLIAIRRREFPSPIYALVTDPDVDTLALFVECRVAKLRARSGIYVDPRTDAIERRDILAQVQQMLTRRYLRHLRARSDRLVKNAGGRPAGL